MKINPNSTMKITEDTMYDRVLREFFRYRWKINLFHPNTIWQ